MKEFFKRFFGSRESAEDTYLANAVDLVDLERRQKRIQRGQVPWQGYL